MDEATPRKAPRREAGEADFQRSGERARPDAAIRADGRLSTARAAFCRIHKTLKVSPAMAAGVTEKLWNMEDIVTLIDARDERKSRR